MSICPKHGLIDTSDGVCVQCKNETLLWNTPVLFPTADVDDPSDVVPEGSFERTRDMLEGVQVERLTAENARLRADLVRVAEESETLRRNAAYMADGLGMMERERDAMRLDLHRLTVDAAAECGGLRAERDAFERQLSSVRFLLSNCDCLCAWVHKAKATLAEPEPIIACAPEVKP